jgi:hypothetical protein
VDAPVAAQTGIGVAKRLRQRGIAVIGDARLKRAPSM